MPWQKLPSESYRNPIDRVVIERAAEPHCLVLQLAPPDKSKSGGAAEGNPMKKPSALGTAIEKAIDCAGRYRRIREPVQYACFYQTPGGQTFAVERVTLNHIRLWLPQNEGARSAGEKEGLFVTKSVPYPNLSDSRRYGRLSSLKSVVELSDAALYLTAVVAAEQALVILGALA